ncbi:hypothetical protein [Paraburkholderia sp. BL10I2N1]|uniref:hypothetical protein n=1 Tax=Paraburkholderia sp. BL10I2N1 TaxID=1938796 RepID=UPI0010DA18A0|nr:hypothetical protein [Paraburkholderia sp. BL10I2N1]TDN57986.1 hypothetical protein B0G77_8844 [Paraburkholderia sp. BL10I2N1]
MRNTGKAFHAAVTFAACAALTLVTLIAMGLASHPASAAAASEPFVWPASLAPMGDGYPKAGDACRRLGEWAATVNYLDHMAVLVGCPGDSDSASVRAILRDPHARVVGAADGVTLISIPTEGKCGTGVSGTMNSTLPAHNGKHAKSPGTAFSATGTLPCARRVGQPTHLCRFGVVRATATTPRSSPSTGLMAVLARSSSARTAP